MDNLNLVDLGNIRRVLLKKVWDLEKTEEVATRDILLESFNTTLNKIDAEYKARTE